jgi:glutathione S-transferase
MKLHWSPRSPYVRKVMICAIEKGIADRIVRVRSVVAMKNPNVDLMRTNPLGKIPTLVLDDGRVLFDSVVICEYLDGLSGSSPLFPPSGDARWAALRWHALGDGMLDTCILWRNEKDREHPLAVLLRAFEAKVNAALSLLERETDALDVAKFGIGHITIGCALGYLDFRFADFDWRAAHPKLTRWFETFSNRPSARDTIPIDDSIPTP